MTHDAHQRSIAVVTAGLSQPSSTRLLADRLAEAAASSLGRHGEDVRVEVVELRDLAHDITDNLLTGFPSGALADAVRLVETADAVIAVTPVFSASYSGLFKSFVDVLPERALEGTPVLLAATAGTARHSLVLEFAMRPLFAYLRAAVLPTAVFAASEDFGSGGAGGSLSGRVSRAGEELADAVLGRQRPAEVDPFVAPTPFAQLLAG
jgi:FMN reductase